MRKVMVSRTCGYRGSYFWSISAKLAKSGIFPKIAALKSLTPSYYYRNALQVFRYLEAKSLHDQRKHAIIIEFLQTPSEGLCRNLRILAGFRVTVQIFDFLRAARAVHLLNV